MSTETNNPEIRLNQQNETVEIILLGDWVIDQKIPYTEFVFPELFGKSIYVDAEKIGEWDSRLITFLVKLKKYAIHQKLSIDLSTLPQGAQRLLDLAFVVQEREGARKHSHKTSIFTRSGLETLKTISRLKSLISIG